jgi:hypothetical protein
MEFLKSKTEMTVTLKKNGLVIQKFGDHLTEEAWCWCE